MAAQQTFAFFQPEKRMKKTLGNNNRPSRLDTKATKLRPGTVGTESPPIDQTPAAAGSPHSSATCPGLSLRALDEGVSETPAKIQNDDLQDTLQQLRHKIGCVQTARKISEDQISTGSHEIDSLLPTGGLKIAALTEWLASSDSSGAATLSLIAAANHLRQTAGPLVIVDQQGDFYPPAASAFGIAYEKMILVRPQQRADFVWSIDQALRCESVAGVWAIVHGRLDDRDARRFQLAAEIGNTPGFLVRDQSVRGQPSFAETRFYVTTKPALRQTSSANRFLQVTLDRCRGGVIGQSAQVQIDDSARINPVPLPTNPVHETAAVHLASQLANPATARSTDRQQRRA